MKFFQILKLSTRVFRTRPGRTFLTVLGISIGIGAVVFLVSLGYGLQKMMFEQITTEESLLVLDVSSPRTEIISIDRTVLKRAVEIDNVEEVSLRAAFSGQIIMEDLASDILIYAVDPSFIRLTGNFLSGGEYIKEEESYETILSTSLLRTFNIRPAEAIGREVTFTFFIPRKEDGEGTEEIDIIEKEERYKIVGIIEDDITTFSYIPLGTLEDLKIDTFSDLKIKVSSSAAMENVREELINMGFMVSSLSEMIEEADKIFNIMKIILAAFGMVALFVAAVGLVNTMTVALLERTNEIGIIKAIGGEDKNIKHMFLAEATIIGFLGGVGGITLARTGAFIFNGVLNILARELGGQAVNIFYTPLWFILFIIIFSTIIGFVSGFFPARRAAFLNPLDALRYK